jgi:TPR repeat protein
MPRVCPHCGSRKIRSASLHAHDGIRHLVFDSPLRCRECRQRFWVLNPFKPLLLLAAVGALIAATRWIVLDPSAEAVPAKRAPLPPAHAQAAISDANEQLRLGLRYAEGDGVIMNPAEAAKWFARAAKQGLAEAEYQYGLALQHGRGVVQDYRAAFSWIEKSARRGHAQAQYSLGELYRFGTGTAIDKARAYLWYNLSAAQGVDVAAKARDSLVWQLKPEQIAAMQEEARHMSLAPGAVTPAAPVTDTPATAPPAAAPASAAPTAP